MRPSNFHAALLLAAALLTPGCAGYKMGSTAGFEAGARSVRVELFHNDTLEPRLLESIATATRREIQRDGTYKLTTWGNDADVVLRGVVTDYERTGVSFQSGDVLTVRDYQLTLLAEVTAEETSTGRKLFEGKVTGRTTIRTGSDLTSAERQAAPLLAEDLARNIVSRLADGTW